MWTEYINCTSFVPRKLKPDINNPPGSPMNTTLTPADLNNPPAKSNNTPSDLNNPPASSANPPVYDKNVASNTLEKIYVIGPGQAELINKIARDTNYTVNYSRNNNTLI